MCYLIFPETIRKLISKAAFICFAIISITATAQPGLWRIGLQVGAANTYSKFETTPVIVNDRLSITTPIGTWWQANVERSVTPHLSLKAGLGRMRLPYRMTTYSELRDASGRLLITTGGTSGGGDALTYTSLGIVTNSPAWGPFILTAGIDFNLRYNRRAKSNFVYGGFGQSKSFISQDTLIATSSYRFTPQLTSTFSLALAPQLGIDIRLSNRLFVSALATYNIGLGYIRQATSNIELDNQSYEGRFAHRGSFLGYRAGIKYTVGHLNPLSKLTYTVYNLPQLQTRWYEAERKRTFTKRSLLLGTRIGYFSEYSSPGFDFSLQVQGGYFIINRLAMGLKAKYIRDYRSQGFPILQSWLIGPTLRYHISPTRVSPFVEGSYQIGRLNFNSIFPMTPLPNISRMVNVFSLAVGLNIRLNEKLRFDISAENQRFSYYPSLRATNIRPELGLTYLFMK